MPVLSKGKVVVGSQVCCDKVQFFADLGDLPPSGAADTLYVIDNNSLYIWNGTSYETMMVQSVTGTAVDNTDPANPVINTPANLIFYSTSALSGILTYNKLVTSLDDPDYDTLAVNVPIGPITSTGQLVGALVSEAGILSGNPGTINISTIGEIRRTSGTGVAEFYFEIYQRDSLGVETLISTSNNTGPVSSAIFQEFSASGLFNNGTWTPTDRVVIKYYATRIPGGSNPSYEFLFGGTNPVRTLFPVSASLLLNVPIAVGVTTITGGTSGSILTVGPTGLLDEETLSLTTTGTTGAATLTGTAFNVPQYQGQLTLTTTGSSGAATLITDTINIPNYSLSGLGGVPTTRQLTINGTTQDLSANRTWNVGTVTSVSALTIGSTGTDITSTVATGTTTPVITLNVPTASATNRGALSSADWTTFNAKQSAITLTTTGTSGAATFIGNTLNIPQYQGTLTFDNTPTNGSTNPVTSDGVFDALALKQDNVTLTTTGTSGAATLVGATLNIPQYQAALTNPVTGTGTAGQVSYWSGTNTQTGSSNLFWDAANNRLGVGTNSPTEKMQVVDGNVLIDNNREYRSKNTAGSSLPMLKLDSSNNLQIGSVFAGGSTILYTSTAYRWFQYPSSVATERMQLNAAGNLMIGGTFTDAGQRLQVIGSTLLRGSGTTSSTTALLVQNSTPSALLTILDNGASTFSSSVTANSFVKSGGTSTQYLMADGNTSTLTNPVTGTGTAGQVSYWSGTGTQTGSANLFWDAANNRLGVGTTTPTLALQVERSSNGSETIWIRNSNTGAGAYSTLAAASYGVSPSTTGTVELRSHNFNHGAWPSTGMLVSNSSLTNGLAIFSTAGNITFNTASNGTERARIESGGNFVLGTTSASARFHVRGSGTTSSTTALLVQNSAPSELFKLLDNGAWNFNGDGIVKGSGNTSATTALTVQNSDGTVLFSVRNDNLIFGNGFFPTTSSSIVNIYGNTGAIDSIRLRQRATSTHTSATRNHVLIEDNYSPTSGTGSINLLNINATINQTGGANGITRGLYVNPTLTAAADWRSVEWSNNTGWGLYGAGTANNYLGGRLGIGTTTLVNATVRNDLNITGSSTSYGYLSLQTVQSDVTAAARIFHSEISTQAASFTLTNLQHFVAAQGTFGASSTVTNQFGFRASPSLTGATNNYGFYGDIASGTGRWNLYMNGTADNYLAGSLGIGSTSLSNSNIRIAKALTGGTIISSVANIPTINSDVTAAATIYTSLPTTQAASFVLSTLNHYLASSVSIGAGSSITDQYGFNCSNLTQATNNYGFYGNIASGTGRWNLYMNGTAANYLAGNTSIGTTTSSGRLTVRGSGTTSSTKALVVNNSTPTAIFEILDNGRIHQTVPGSANNYNTLFGTGAGASASLTGLYNTFFGYSSGTNNTSANYNSFYGLNSGLSNTTGESNSFFGAEAGLNNSTAANNSFFGLAAGRQNTTGENNSAFGREAGRGNTTGGSNSFFGVGSGYALVGSNNSLFGRHSGRYISGGSNLTSADNSVFIGFDTRAAANSQTNQVVIGYQAIGLGSNTTVIGNSSTTQTWLGGDLTLGTTTSSARLTVRGADAGSTNKAIVAEDSTGLDLFTVRNDGAYAFAGGTVAPAQTGYIIMTNLAPDRDGSAIDANAADVNKLANLVGTLIEDLKAKGIILG